MRHSWPSGSRGLLYHFDDFVLDTDRRELRAGAANFDVEPQVFDLLEYLIRHRDRVVSRDELIESIWGGRVVSESALSTRINAVRSAIGDSGNQQRLIKTLPRRGVRFVGEVKEEQKTSEETSPRMRENGVLEIVGGGQADGALPVAIEGQPNVVSPNATPPRRVFVPRVTAGAIATIGIVCFAILTWSYLARSD